jgi:hypothetical protein
MAMFFGIGCLVDLQAELGLFEDQDAAIAEGDFFGLPGGGLVELVGLRLGSGPALA